MKNQIKIQSAQIHHLIFETKERQWIRPAEAVLTMGEDTRMKGLYWYVTVICLHGKKT
jgi:hypothetical protein